MKRILFSIAILGMAASAAIAKDLTVTHKSWGTQTSFRKEIKMAMEDAGISDYSEITTLKIITQPNSNINSTYFNTTYTTDDGVGEGRLMDLLKDNLEEIDLSEAKFYNDLLPPGGDLEGSGFLPNMAKLRKVVLPDELRLISGAAFKNCNELVEINLPNSLVNIGQRAFMGCSKLELTEFPETVTKIQSEAFNESAVRFSKLPDGLIILGEKAFRATKVTISGLPSTLFEPESTFGNSVFVNCFEMTEFTIPAEMTSIPNQTFYWEKDRKDTRNFYCLTNIPPKAAYDTGGYTGAFGNAASFENINLYIPFGCKDAYLQDNPYKTMNILQMFDEPKGFDDFFSLDYDEEDPFVSPALEVKEVVGDEEFDLNFDREGVYRLRFTPNSDENSLTYISSIYFANENNSPADVRALANAMPKPGDVLYSASDGVCQHVWVDVPVFADSPKLVVELKAGTQVGVSEINSDADQYKYVYNISGICVAKGENVDMSALPSGTYIVKSAKSVIKVIK